MLDCEIELPFYCWGKSNFSNCESLTLWNGSFLISGLFDFGLLISIMLENGELNMENLEIKKLAIRNGESEKAKSYQLSFRVTKEKLKFLKCYLIENERTANDFFNEMIDRLMSNEERKNQRHKQNLNGVTENLIADKQQIK